MNRFESQFFEGDNQGETAHWNDVEFFVTYGYNRHDMNAQAEVFAHNNPETFDEQTRDNLKQLAMTIDNPDLQLRAFAHIASKSLAWLDNGERLNWREYRHGEKDARVEVSSRLGEAVGVIARATRNRLTNDPEVMGETLKLVLSAQGVVQSNWFKKDFSPIGNLPSNTKKGLTITEELTDVALDLLTKMSTGSGQHKMRLFEDLNDVYGSGSSVLAYSQQLDYVRGSKTLSKETKSAATTRIVRTISELPDALEEMPNAVSHCLKMAYLVDDQDLQNAMLDKAVRVAKDNQMRLHKRSRLEKFFTNIGKTFFETPVVSVEQDVWALHNNMVTNFDELIKSHPIHIEQVIALGDDEYRADMYKTFADKLAANKKQDN